MALLILIPLLIFALLFPSAARSQAPLQRVIITYSSRSIASIDLFVAQERGFFREEGLDPQLVQVRATAAIAATVSGDVNALGSIGSKDMQEYFDLTYAYRQIPAPVQVGTVIDYTLLEPVLKETPRK